MRALIVDDAEDNLYYLRALLEGHGWTVESARHGAEALVRARRTVPDLVISDLLMPVMDGYTLLRNWRADARLKHVPFVVYTATYTEAEDERLALGLGADAFILKPAEPEAFLARILEVQAKGAAAGPGSPTASGHDENALLKRYSETLIHKLEEKTLQLEESNRALKKEASVLQLRDRAIQAVSQGIVITDPLAPDNPIIYASPSFERMTGYASDEVMGKNCRFLSGEGTDKRSLAHVRDALSKMRGCSAEMLNYRKDGTPFWNSLVISPVLDASGKVVNFVGVQTDVTERRELEEQLRQAQKMEAVGQLAAGVAHDFNNLLSVILSYASLVGDNLNDDDPMREEMKEIERAGERAAELTRQLLAFSRRQMLQPRVLDLGQLVAGTEKMLKRMLGTDIELSLHASRASGRVRVDPNQIDQILLNLAVNSRDAMPKGGTLSIETTNVDLDATSAADHPGVSAGAYVLLTFKDDGVGMDAATRARIFEPFFTTKEQGKGTGLGLSTVFGIVKQSLGHILVSSEVGHGTTFEIFLPRVEGAIEATSIAPEPATLRGTETILLVEDEAQVRQLTRAILQRNGYNVLEAQNGGEAFLICEQYSGVIQLLLTDVVMPRMSGRELAERLAPLQPKMVVLFMSGYTEHVHVHRVELEAGIAFIEKPITPNALLRKVREVLAGHPSDT